MDKDIYKLTDNRIDCATKASYYNGGYCMDDKFFGLFYVFGMMKEKNEKTQVFYSDAERNWYKQEFEKVKKELLHIDIVRNFIQEV